MEAKSKEKLYQLLYQALIEIRFEADSIDNNMIFALSDLFHNLPIKLRNLKADDDENYEMILDDLIKDAQSRGIVKWIENCLRQM